MRGPAALLALALPLGAVAAVLWLPAGWSAVPLLALAAVTLAQSRPVRAPAALVAAALAALAVVSAFWQSALAAMLYPVAVNAGLLASFLLSLRDTPAIERMARLADPSIPAAASPYLRRLTKVWCGFFALNGLVALATALHGDREIWALYNGLIAYGLIGLLIIGERWLRPRLTPSTPDDSAIQALLAGEGLDSPVASRRGAAVTRGDLLAMTRARVEGMTGAREWVLAEGDALDFAALLLAVGVLGHTLHVPPNHRPATVERLLAAHPEARLAAAAPAPVATAGSPLRLDPRATVVFHTSGTTGEPTAHARPLAALLEESQTLEAAFGEAAGDRAVSGTVPHAFIYGALFRVVWPLRSGRVFDAEPIANVAALPPGPRLLVSSPSFLERLQSEAASPGADNLLVFSSGSPLAPEAARLLRARGWSVREVYGSTESGGVAWRQGEDAAWTPLPGVSVEVGPEGIAVRSPHAPGGRARLSDRAEMMPDGRFHLLGRADRIAKVEGRRVSLGMLEATIRAHPSVAEAAVFPGDEGGRLAVLVVPRWESTSLDLDGLVAELRSRLAAENDLTVVPRRWRFAPSMPSDARGKRSLDMLRAAVGLDAADPWSALPRLLAFERAAGAVRLRLEAPRDHPFFPGHFPGHPILPGIGLVHWAAMLAPIAGAPGPFANVLQLKFQEPTFPGHVVDLEFSPSGDSLAFAFTASGRPRASGILAP